ncbi:MAG: alpha/beta hydrolase [Gemmatimonadota bacterium]|nr:alpha/beta hydrolase [Gemmatimonadota bacterium]
MIPRDGLSVRSGIPTLILSGELDPWIPPTWGRMLLPNLPNAQMVEVGGRSHTPGFSACSDRMIARFVDAPDESAFDQCAAKDAGVLFGK